MFRLFQPNYHRRKRLNKVGLKSVCEHPPFTDLVPQGRLKITQDTVLGTTWLTFSRPLRDFSSLCAWFPGLHPGLLSAVPAGLNR